MKAAITMFGLNRRSLKRKQKQANSNRRRQALRKMCFETLDSRLVLATAPLGDQFVVSEALGFSATPAAIAVNTDNSFIAAWESFEQDGSGFGVYAQRFNAAGTALDPTPFLVNSTTSREQSAPAIAVDANGNALIVWQSKGQDEGNTFGIYGQWYNNAGTKLGGEFRINTVTAADQKAPSVAIDGSGKATVAWQSFGQDGSDWGVYYTRFDAVVGVNADTTPSGDVLVNDAFLGIQQNPTVAAAANGNFVISWEAIDPLAGDDASLDIYAKVFNSAGTQITLGEQLVNTDQLRDQVTPYAAIDADGDFVIVWTAGGIPGSGSDVFGQRFNELGIRAGQQFRVNDTTRASQVGGVVGMDQNGNFLVTWQSVQQDGFSEGIYGRAYNAAGSILTGETLVNTVTEGPQSLPSIGMNADGRAVTTWHGKNEEHQSALFAQRFDLSTSAPFITKVGGELQLATLVELEGGRSAAAMDHLNSTVVVFESYDEDGDAMGVYAQMLDEFGDPLGSRFLVNTGFTSGNQSAPAVARAPDGRFVVAWQSKDQDGDGYGIYAQRYTAAGVADGLAFQVNTNITGDQTSPAVAMAEDGRFIIVWQGVDGLEEGIVDGTTDIFAQRFNPDGTRNGSEFQVNHFEGTNQIMPAVTMNAVGQFAIAWVSSHQMLTIPEQDAEKSVFVQWYDANGVSVGDEVIAHQYVKDAQESPQIGMDAEGHFVVAWQSINQDGSTWGVYGRQFNNQKVALTGEEFRINEATEGLQRLVGLGVDADGNFVVAYESTAPENTDGISTDIYRREFFPDGTSNGSENLVNTWTGGPQTLPVVARAATGNYGIFWTGQGFSHIDGVHGRLYDITLVDDPGEPSRVPVGDQFLVSATLGFEFSSPAIAVHNDGSFTIAFETFEEDSSGFGIFTERFDSNGNPIANSRKQVNTGVLDDQSAPAIASAGDGRVLIVWQGKDGNGNGIGIFGQWLDAVGDKIGTEFQLNSTLIGDQANPDVAIDEAGRAVVTWVSTGQTGGDGADIVYVTLASIGSTTPSAEQLANSTITGDQLAPRVAASAHDASSGNNQFVITWQGPGPVVEGEASVEVFALRLNALAASVGGEFVVNAIPAKDQILPDLAMDTAGNVAFVWQAEGQTGSGSDVYTRRMSNTGTLLGSDVLVNTTTTRPQRLPSVAMDASGNYIVTWQSQHQDGYSWGIYRQGFDTNGARSGEEVIVNHRVEGPQTAPTAASNADGDAIIAWLGNSATHQPSIFGHLFDLPSTEVAGELLLTSYVGLEDSAPAAAMNSARESVVVWESYGEVEDKSSGLGVFGQLLDAQGLPIGSRFLINENITQGNQGAPAVARTPSGEFVVAWQSEVADGSDDIFARRYSASGVPVGDIFQVNPAAMTGDQKAPTVGIGSDGRFVIAWQSDSGDGSTDIMAQRYLADGSADGTAFRVNNETALDQFAPSVAMNVNGQFVIAWVSDHPAADPLTMADDSEKSIFVQSFSADGQAVSGDEVLVHRYVKDAQEAPVVGIDNMGRFVVAWQSINQDGNSWGVFARRFINDKTPIDRREFVVNESRMGPQRFAGLGVDHCGRFVIAWQSNERAELSDTGSGGGGGESPEGSSWDLYSRQYSWDGSPEGGELPVNVWQMGPQTLPVVAQALNGDFGIFWLGQAPNHVEGVNGRLYQNVVVEGMPGPVLSPIADQTTPFNTPIDVPLAVSDADTAPCDLTFTGSVLSQLASLDEQYNDLHYLPIEAGIPLYNYRGAQEKYFRDSTQQPYYILPTGKLYLFTSLDNTLAGIEIADVGTDVYANPTLLSEASPTPLGTVAFKLDGMTSTWIATVTPDTNFYGMLGVTVTASDGVKTATQRFNLRVASPGITVVILGDDMIVTGTTEDDTIKVASDGLGGLIVTSNQLINGLPSPQTFVGATSFIANTLGGHDDLWLAAPLTFDSVTVDLGAGNDRLVLGADPNNPINNNVLDPQFGTLGYLTVNGTVEVLGGEGNDQVLERSTSIAGVKSINLGEGNNEYNVYWSLSHETNFTSGSGQDSVYIGYLSSYEASQFNTGAGNDLISYYASRFYKTASLNSEAGYDTVALDVNIYDGAATVDTGSEADYLLFSRSVAYQAVSLTTGGGTDSVLIGKYISSLDSNGSAVYSNGGSNIDQLTLQTDAEADSVQIAANVMRLFYANLGDAYDDAEVEYNIFTDGLLDGGPQRARMRLKSNINLQTVNAG